MGLFFCIHSLHAASSASRENYAQINSKLKFVTKKALSKPWTAREKEFKSERVQSTLRFLTL